MKTPKIVEAMGQIDDQLIAGAVTYKKKKTKTIVKWLSTAACLAVLVVVAPWWYQS